MARTKQTNRHNPMPSDDEEQTPSPPHVRIRLTNYERERRSKKQAEQESRYLSNTSTSSTSASRPATQQNTGAPTDQSLLASYDFHIASQIWIGANIREPLKVHNHIQNLNDWPIENECNYVKLVVERSGLLFVASHSNPVVDKSFVLPS